MYDFRAFDFGHGKHKTREQGMCVMEAVAYLAGEEHSDTPDCASPVIGRLAIWLNDSLDNRQRRDWMAGMPYRLVGTAASPDIEQQRAYMAADWAVRVVCPRMFERLGLKAEAQKLRDLPVVNSEQSAARAARSAGRAAAADAAADAAYAADAAARSAGRAAAADAAADAAYAAAYAAYAADAAARSAARAAARSAAAAGSDLEFIQRSCLELIDRMIRLTEIRETVPQRCESPKTGYVTYEEVPT